MQHTSTPSILVLVLDALKARYPGQGSIDIQQLSLELACSVSTIHRAVQAGTMPAPLRPTGAGRGRAASWPLPVVAAFQAGVWQPSPDTKPPPAPAPDMSAIIRPVTFSDLLRPEFAVLPPSTKRRRGRSRKDGFAPGSAEAKAADAARKAKKGGRHG